ncbi:MFS transporter [Terrilactibacillus sp. BCM23-1]|uniref:MFS transporter n=1 Tax=Terrilactibacillus tamarindi TaxID=2599694 RepID=A0A6N8CNL6_9BACI|nr:MFS transporter [Terrilactibacillus tamarindi]MTT31734.1 MFS transporter [Terrilactibacillus tamarindi]
MKKISILFFFITFVIGTDTFLVSPLLPTLRHTYHVSPDISGWLVSAYALGYVCFALIAGPISDGMDRKKIMIYGLMAFVMSTFLCGLASNFWLMIVFRFIAGISASFVTPQVWASIPHLVKSENIVRSMGYATAGLSISQVIGVPIGSYLAVSSWRIPFFSIAGAALILLFPIILMLPSIPSVRQGKKQSLVSTYSQLFVTPRATKYFIAYFLFQLGNFASFSFIGSWFTKDFSLGVAEIGTAMFTLGVGNTIGSLFGSSVVKKLGEAKSLYVSLVVLAVLYAILPFSLNLIMAEIILTFIFLIGGFVFPVFMSTMQSLSITARGTISALSSATMYFGTTIGGIIGGILLSHFSGFIGVAWFTTLLYIFSLVVYRSSGLFNGTAKRIDHHKINEKTY